MQPQTLQYRGDLSKTPLPEVLAIIHRYKVPGVIQCTRGVETKSVFIDDGNIIFATSTNLADALGQRLLQQGRITRGVLDESVRRLQSEGKRQGAVLVEMNVLQPKELYVAVREQVQAIVWSLFEWEQGQVLFNPGRERSAELIKLNIPTRQAVLQGVRRVRDARMLVSRMGTKTTVFQRNASADVSDLLFSDDAERLFRAVDGRKSLFELTNTPPLAPVQNAKLLYGFFALELIAVKAPIKVQVKTPGFQFRGQS